MMVVNSLDELVHDPHLEATGFWQEFDHPQEGQIRCSSPPMNFSATPASIRRLAPRLGEHSMEVLREAGLDEETIGQMLAAGETGLPD
jgi:crotonobetainyl-CoA:carnitine CoA-transferase CaiB-like acyl-CoA transferase